ncbi:MAG: metallophosphoesterase family protein [Nitrososphaerales archaeon]
MPRFAHMSDVHIGAFRQPELRDLVTRAFDLAIGKCIDEGVDFVVMSGDIFDSNIPDLSSVRKATGRIREAREKGIRFYVVYGSHDYSPNHASVVDVLESAGLFTKVDQGRVKDGKLELDFVVDETGAKICGISGKKLSLDRADYASLDRQRLESEPGFKVFVFHGAIDELKPQSLTAMEGMPASYLPENFDYYAGGHVHVHSSQDLPGRRNVVYPGPLFATDFRDLEPLAKGAESGFYIVDFEKEVNKVTFAPTKVCEVLGLEYSAHGKDARRARLELSALAQSSDVEGKVVLLRVHGELSEGSTSDIGFSSIRKELASRDPICILPNFSQLTSRDLAIPAGPPKAQHQTEREFFSQRIASVKSSEPRLIGESGAELSIELLKSLKEERKENETKGDYQERTEEAGVNVLGLAGDL